MMTESFDHEDVSREVIKCVVVGDSGVGKTRLICARACDQKVGLEQLLTVHTPTVWAIDSYRISREILDKSFQCVDNVAVSLRLWDTFGDHNNDRRFAYGRSDVVLLCFSVLNPRSLHHAKTVWYPEIRRMCPGAPVVLVGCKNDLRHLCVQSSFQKLVAERRPFGKPVLPADIVFPEQGRIVSREIGAPYYETSVLSFFGIHDLFANVIRAALCRRRQVRFWMTTLDTVRLPLLQAPYLPPRPACPDIQIAPSSYRGDMLRLASFLLHSPSDKDLKSLEGFFDCILEVKSNGAENPVRIPCHKLILASSSQLFRQILVCPSPDCSECLDDSSNEEATELSYPTSQLSPYEADTCHLLSHTSAPGTGEFGVSGETLSPRVPGLRQRTPDCFSKNSQESWMLGMDVVNKGSALSPGMTLIRVAEKEKEVSSDACGSLVFFFYTGQIRKETPKKALLRLAKRWKVPLLEEFPDSGVEDEHLSEMIRRQFLEERNENLLHLGIHSCLFSDSGVVVSAHRFLLASRCAVMEAMFSNRFREGLSSQVDLAGVSEDAMTKLLVFLYTDNISADHKREHSCVHLVEALEIANRLCQLRLVNELERCVVSEYNRLVTRKHFGDEGGIVEEVLSVLEHAQMYNAEQLSKWCLNFVCCNYNRACKQHPKLVKNLSQGNQDFLARNRWPPIWYLKEFDWYERSLRDRQKSEQSGGVSGSGSRLKRPRTRSGCLCFSKASRNQTESGSL